MIKCDNCGEKISLETIKCPKCNAINEIAVEHMTRLEKYDKKYTIALENAFKHTKEHKIYMTCLAVCMFLAIGVILSWFWSFIAAQEARDYTQNRFSRHQEEYYEAFDKYINEGDYDNAIIIDSKTHMYEKADENHKPMAMILYDYSRIVNCLNMSAAIKEDSYVRNDFVTYRERFIDNIVLQSENEKNRKIVIDLMKQIDNMLKWMYGFSDEDCSKFWRCDNTDLKVFLNDKFGGINQ